jgi:hypothetical protein
MKQTKERRKKQQKTHIDKRRKKRNSVISKDVSLKPKVDDIRVHFGT